MIYYVFDKYFNLKFLIKSIFFLIQSKQQYTKIKNDFKEKHLNDVIMYTNVSKLMVVFSVPITKPKPTIDVHVLKHVVVQ